MINWVFVGKKHHVRFRHLFHKSIGVWMHPLTGFDIGSFDDYLQVPDGVAMSDYLLENYGQEAHDMIRNIIAGV